MIEENIEYQKVDVLEDPESMKKMLDATGIRKIPQVELHGVTLVAPEENTLRRILNI